MVGVLVPGANRNTIAELHRRLVASRKYTAVGPARNYVAALKLRMRAAQSARRDDFCCRAHEAIVGAGRPF